MNEQLNLETLYFKDINRYSVLSEKEERNLIKSVQNNSTPDISTLITSNLRFVATIAKKNLNKGLNLLELINEGNIGLIKAAQHFDFNKNIKFITYASWWIRQRIQKALKEQVVSVHIPENRYIFYNKFKSKLSKNNWDYYKTINMPQFKKHEQEITDVENKLHDISLDSLTNLNDEKNITLQDTIGEDPTQYIENEREELENILKEALNILSDKEKTIIKMIYGINLLRSYGIKEISIIYKTSVEIISGIRDKSLTKIFRNYPIRTSLIDYIRDLD
jgi:RNA polymerase primary sigma factor